MNPTDVPGVVKLEDTDLTLADPAEDIRGRTVFDRDGAEIGEVKSLFVDDREAKVRFLEIRGGSVLGLGGTTRLLPVQSVSRVDEGGVHVEHAREHVKQSPEYDPELEHDHDYYGEVYGHYGYGPFWAGAVAHSASPRPR